MAPRLQPSDLPPEIVAPLTSSTATSFTTGNGNGSSSSSCSQRRSGSSSMFSTGTAGASPPAGTGPRPQPRRRPAAVAATAAGCFTWAALRRAALLAVALGGLLGCCGGVLRVRGQEVVLEPGSAGCLADKAPGPPTNLKATPKDGRVLLRWEPPTDGACVSTYVVNVIDPLFRTDVPAQSTSTGRQRVVVEGLTNGRTYLFQVQAYSSRLMTGGVAQVRAMPTDLCNLSEAPGKPTNLRLQTGDGWARLCWDGVDNDACVDQYRVSVSLQSGPDFRTSSDGQISRGGCANVTGLVSGAKYLFTVTPASGPRGQGTPASLTAEVGASAAAQNGWTCRSMEGCPPNRGGLCGSGGGCPAVARRGDCRVPALVDIDWTGKQVTQWCASSCACELGPAQAGVLMGNPRGLAGAAGLLAGAAGFTSAAGLTGAALAGSLASGGGRGSGGLGGLGGLGSSTAVPLGGAGSLMSSGGAMDGGLSGGFGAGGGGGGGGAGALLGQGRMGQFVGNMAEQMVSSGVVGEAAGKVAQHVVSNQVNAVLQGMMAQAAATTSAVGSGGGVGAGVVGGGGSVGGSVGGSAGGGRRLRLMQ